MRILCIEADSQYGATNSFLDSLARGFRAQGHEVTRIDVHAALRSSTTPPVDLVFSFGGVGTGLPWAVPFLTWLVDSPVFTPTLSAMQPDRDGVLVVAAEHQQVVQSFLGLDLPAGFAPHAVEVDCRLPAPEFGDDDRPIDVLFVGSYEEAPDPDWSTSDPRIRGTLEYLFRLADERWDRHMRELDVSCLFLEAAQHNSLPTRPAAHWEIASLLAWLDQHLRNRRRAACIRALDRAGVAVHVVGSGWERLDDLGHVKPLGPVDYADVVAMARQSKVVLNAGPPLFNTGWHERIPMAMAAGALAVTETNDWIGNDADLARLVTAFEMPEYEALPGVVVDALQDPARPDRARTAYDVVRAHHTWACRAEAILQMVEV